MLNVYYSYIGLFIISLRNNSYNYLLVQEIISIYFNKYILEFLEIIPIYVDKYILEFLEIIPIIY